MKITTNIAKRERKTFYINQFDGVDYSGTNIKRGQTCINLINKNGKIQKRNGLIEIAKFNAKIDHVQGVSFDNVERILVYSNKEFLLESNNGEMISINNTAPVEFAPNTSQFICAPLNIFKYNDVYYIIGAGELLALGKYDGSIQLRSVKKMAYIPTTTTGIMPNDSTMYFEDRTVNEASEGVWYIKTPSGYQPTVLSSQNPWNPLTKYYTRYSSSYINPTTLDSPNILTQKRKNNLVGVGHVASYYLDAKNILSNPAVSIVLNVKENETINQYQLWESQNPPCYRAFEVGDNLAGVTIKVTASTEPITETSLQTAESVKGKVLAKGNNFEIYWASLGFDMYSWNHAYLKCEYLDQSDNHHVLNLGEAVRNSVLEPYTVTYFATTFIISASNECKLTYVHSSGRSDDYVYALLPSNIYQLQDQNCQTWGQINHLTGEVKFTKPTLPPYETPNIVVDFAVQGKYPTNAIDKCTFGTMFGVNGNTDRLFLSGNKEFKNLDFCCDSANVLYFPEDCVYQFGSDSSAITGYARLSDDSLAVFKDDITDSNLFVRRGRWVTQSVQLGGSELQFKKADFNLVGCYLSATPENSRTIAYLDGEPIFVAKNGIYSLKTSTDIINQSRFATNRGAYIDDYIRDHMTKIACAINYKNDYYLALANKVFIAQSYKYNYDNHIRQYNWWEWDNINASCLAVIKNDLYFGMADGRLCTFSAGYADTSFEHFDEGSFMMNDGDPNIVIDKRLGLEEFDRITCSEKYYCLVLDNAVVEHSRIKGNIKPPFVYADNVGSSGLQAHVKYKVGNYDPQTDSFELLLNGEPVNINSGGFRLSFENAGIETVVAAVNHSEHLSTPDSMVMTYDGLTVIPIAYDGNPLPNGSKMRKRIEIPVIAVYKTSLTELGYPTMLKDIYKVGLDVGAPTSGKVLVSVCGRTNNDTIFECGEQPVINVNDYVNFTFLTDIQKSCYSRCKLRNMNSISVMVISKNDRPFELKGISVEFSLERIRPYQ